MNLEYLKQLGSTPRLHPNGFIQLDIERNRRLHIWFDHEWGIKGQNTSSPIHDHIFNMFSRVLKGVLYQVRYDFKMDHWGNPDYEIFTAKYEGKSNSQLEPTGVFGDLEKDDQMSQVVRAGDSYFQHAFTFHESRPLELPVVTMMTKERAYTDFTPRVLVPFGEKPDNEFRRDSVAPGLLWQVIEDSL